MVTFLRRGAYHNNNGKHFWSRGAGSGLKTTGKKKVQLLAPVRSKILVFFLTFPAKKVSQLLASCTVVGSPSTLSRDVASHITRNKAIGTSVGFGKRFTGKLQWPLFS